MASDPTVMLHFKDLDVGARLRGRIERRCHALLAEFPEVTHLELSLAPDALGLVASGRVTGKDTELAIHASGPEPRAAADQVLDRLRQALRRSHDKRIFARRRAAQKRAEARKRPGA
jgi:ribosome-associated translation inhibitor RaiA